MFELLRRLLDGVTGAESAEVEWQLIEADRRDLEVLEVRLMKAERRIAEKRRDHGERDTP